MKAKAVLFAVAALAVTQAYAQTAQAWMSSDVAAAWAQGYKGQGTTITVVDDFKTSTVLGTLGLGKVTRSLHGNWTSLEAGMVAPKATINQVTWGKNAIQLSPKGLNVVNLSYAWNAYVRPGYTGPVNVNWDAQQASIISAAKNGTAVVVKAAGNDAIAIGATNKSNYTDALNTALRGSKSVLYVGALADNGTTARKAVLAKYSNTAGLNVDVQNRFLVVGVKSSVTGLAGTSFAAPIVSGYSAILGSKFTNATPVAISNRLLSTARTDTVANYNAATHGRGEASLARAIAPVSIK